MRTNIRRIGAWNTFSRMAVNLEKDLRQARIICLRRWGLKAEGIAKKHIGEQDLANGYWPSLSPRYLAWKQRQGYSSDTLVMTSTYFQSITNWVDVTGEQVYVGVKSTRTYKTKNKIKKVADIARIQEFGNATIPKRPLWEPTFNEVMAWHEQNNKPGDVFREIMLKKYSVRF